MLLPGVHCRSLEELVKIYGVAVKFGPVNTDKFCLPCHGDPTAPAHASTINHKGVEADNGFDSMLFGQFRDGSHHDSRTDGNNQVDLFPIVDEPFQLIGNKSMATCRPVIRSDEKFKAEIPHLFSRMSMFFVRAPMIEMI